MIESGEKAKGSDKNARVQRFSFAFLKIYEPFGKPEFVPDSASDDEEEEEKSKPEFILDS